MSKCPISKDGRCQSIYAGGAWCDGYSKNCTLRQTAEQVVNVALAARKRAMESFGIRPNGGR